MLTGPTPEIDPAIDVLEDIPEVVRFILPSRELGRWRLAVVAAGWIAVGIACWLLRRPVIALCVAPLTLGEITTLLLWLMIASVVAGIPLKWVLELLYGHVEIEVSAVQLSVLRKFCWSTRTRIWEVGEIKYLQIAKIEPSRTGLVTTSGPLESLCALTGVQQNGKRFAIAMAYPRRLLESLSAGIASHFPPSPQTAGMRADLYARTPEGQPFHIAEPLSFRELLSHLSDESLARPEERFVQPQGSRIRYEVLEDGISMEFPPVGVWSGSAGMFPMGLGLVACNIGFTLLFLFAGEGIGQLFQIGLAMSPFWLGAAALLVAGWNMGNRHAAIVVAGDTLKLIQISYLKTHRLEWTQSEIATIDIGDSGMESNDSAVRELQIIGPKGKLFGMLAGHDPQEIVWAATLLRYALFQRHFPSEVHAPQPSRSLLGSSETRGRTQADILDIAAEEDAQVSRLPREIAGYYADGLGGLAIVIGKMTLFFSWVPVLGLMMTIPVGAFGLLLASFGFMLGIARGTELRWTSLKAAGLCLLGITVSAASTWIALYFLQRR